MVYLDVVFTVTNYLFGNCFTFFHKQEAQIYSVMWKPAGRRLELSACMVNGSVQGEIFPNMKYGLNGRRFSVTVKEVSSLITV